MGKVCWPLALALCLPAWTAGQARAEPGASAASELQVWLENQSDQAGQTVLLPYVKALQAVELYASVTVTKRGGAVNARVSQQASLEVPADRPVLLGRLALRLALHDVCVMDLVLSDLPSYRELARYRIDCHQGLPHR